MAFFRCDVMSESLGHGNIGACYHAGYRRFGRRASGVPAAWPD